MPKDIPISNGHFLINFDFDYQVRDIYFPYVGQENHSRGLPFKFAVWCDGKFSPMGPEWQKDLRYKNDSLITDVFLQNFDLGIELRCHDAIDMDFNLYMKRIDVTDTTGKARRIRLFFGHDFHLYGNDIGDTAFFDPRIKCVLHYKAKRYFLISCRSGDKWEVEHFSCTDRDLPHKPGAWKDAEDGKLNGNPVGWGLTQSAVGIWLDVPASGTATGYYCMAAGIRYQDVAAVHKFLEGKDPNLILNRTSKFWEAWIQGEPRFFADLPGEVFNIFNRSILILRTQIDNEGAIIAANDSDIVRFGRDTYSYMWGRDGAFVAVALSKAGFPALCRHFFRFVASIMTSDGYLFQHYNPDGSMASNWHPWVVNGQAVLPIQEDSTALVLWALWKHFESEKDIDFVWSFYRNMILRAANFMLSHRDKETGLPLPCYDLWEERYGTHLFTVSAVIAGMRAAANFARLFQDVDLAEKYEAAIAEIKKGIYDHMYHQGLKRYARSGYRNDKGYELDEVLDISLLGLVTLGEFDPREQRIEQTVQAIYDQLWIQSPVGGLARYYRDRYQWMDNCPDEIQGNPWFISTLWLADYYIMRADDLKELRKAVPYLIWCARNALPSGVLAEQVHPIDGSPLSVSPLTWSHSAYVWTIMEYTDKYYALKKKMGR